MRETKFKQTEAGIIPIDWNTGSLSELFEFGNGYTPSKAVGEYWNNGNIPWFRVEDIRSNGNVLNDSLQHITPLAVKGELFPSNSFIISTSATVGEYAYVTVPYLANQRFVCLIKKHDIIDDGYFLSLCQVLGQWCRDNCDQGSSFVSVNMPNFRNHEIPLPPLAEQRKIAKALSDIDGLISSLAKLIEKKQNIKTATMQQLLTGKKRLDGFTQPWVEVSLDDNCTIKARIGWQGLRTDEYLSYGDYLLITGTDFDEGSIKWDTCNFVSEWRYSQDTNIQVKNGDVLVTKDGTIGKVAFVKNLPCPATLNSGVFVIRPKDPNTLTCEYLNLVFKSSLFDDFIRQLKAGSTIVHLYQKDLVTFNLFYPRSVEEQIAISTIIENMDNEISALESKKAKYESIKKGMMQELLTGRIRLI